MSKLQQLSEEMTSAIKRASVELGRPIETHELEGRNATGHPFLTVPIPDNPLVDGVSTVIESCDPKVQHKSDWSYCPSSGQFKANIPQHDQ